MPKVSDRPWSSIPKTVEAYGSAARYCDACLINLNEGPRRDWVASKCLCPVFEPGGALNRNACHAAAVVLAGGRGGVDAPPEAKRKAARKLVRIYREVLKEEPPASLKQLAGISKE